jgi:hypothetical protein
LEPKPPGQLREAKPGQVNLKECVESGDTRQPPLFSLFWRRDLAEFGSEISMVHVVQRVREAKFTFARSLSDMVVDSFTNDMIPCLQSGQGIAPGGLEVVVATMLVEQR